MTAYRVEGQRCEMCGSRERIWKVGTVKDGAPEWTASAPLYTVCEFCWVDEDDADEHDA